MTLTILIDSREKQPLIFPAHLPWWDGYRSHTHQLLTRTITLETGDYQIEGFPAGACIERKKSLDEIATNVLNPRRRDLFIAELERLRSFSFPILLFENAPTAHLRPTPRNPEPWKAVDSFLELMARYNMGVHFAPMTTLSQRAAAGEWAARLLLQGMKPHGR